VESASKIEEWGLPMMSEDTRGTSLYSMMRASGPDAAARTAALTSAAVAGLRRRQFRSTTEPSGTGTRIANPSIRPASAGRILPTAFAAPVVVGMMFSAAARLRRRSSWATSARRWSFV